MDVQRLMDYHQAKVDTYTQLRERLIARNGNPAGIEHVNRRIAWHRKAVHLLAQLDEEGRRAG